MELYFEEDASPQLAASSTAGVTRILAVGSVRFSFPLSTSYAAPETVSKGIGFGTTDWLRGCRLKSLTVANNSGESFTDTANYVICRFKLASLAEYSGSTLTLEKVKTFRIPSGNSVETNSQQFFTVAGFGNSTEDGCRTFDLLIPRKDIDGNALKSTANKLNIYFTIRVQD